MDNSKPRIDDTTLTAKYAAAQEHSNRLHPHMQLRQFGRPITSERLQELIDAAKTSSDLYRQDCQLVANRLRLGDTSRLAEAVAHLLDLRAEGG